MQWGKDCILKGKTQYFFPSGFYGSCNLVVDLIPNRSILGLSRHSIKNLEKNFECVINNSLISLNSRQKISF